MMRTARTLSPHDRRYGRLLAMVWLPAALAACSAPETSSSTAKTASGQPRDWEQNPYDPEAALNPELWGPGVKSLRDFILTLWEEGYVSPAAYFEAGSPQTAGCAGLRPPQTHGADLTNMPLFYAASELKRVSDEVKARLTFTPDGRYAAMRLDGLELSKVNLSRAGSPRGAPPNVARALLLGINFEETHLPGVNFAAARALRLIAEVTNPEEMLAGLESRKEAVTALNFRGANLAKAKLSSANLGYADLEGAKLQGANLAGAGLSYAKLSNADLEGAKLQGAYLVNADVRLANLVEADLEGAKLQGTDLWGADLEGAKLQGANLEYANLEDANFKDAKLQGANLVEAKLREASLLRAELSDADLWGAKLPGAYLVEAKLQGANLEGADLWGAKLEGANLEGVRYNDETYLPTGFSPDGRGMVKTDE